MEPTVFTVNSRKFDQTIRRSWTGELLGRSDGSIQLVGTFAEEIRHPELGVIAAGTRSRETFFLDRWYNYFVFFEPDGSLRNHYFNICMPPVIGDSVIDYVDLDIDIIRWPDGRVDILDLDEFEANAIELGYPPAIREKAESTLAELREVILQRFEELK